MHSPLRVELPRVLVATNGSGEPRVPAAFAEAQFARDLDLATLVAIAGSARPPVALDIDAVQGLNPDGAAVRFVIEELGIGIVATHRPSIAAAVAERGGLGLLHVLAFDSTGLGRVLDSRPDRPGIGTMISPGPVLGHLLPADLERLPRPVVAYGLIGTAELARSLLLRADAVALSSRCAQELVAWPGWDPSGAPVRGASGVPTRRARPEAS